ncbi:transposase [Sorangium sp. So ce128]
MHCAVRIAADDDQGRERLVRYCTRPAFALDRIELLPDGRIAYLMKIPRRGRTHRVMNPLEFRARLAALIPPPKIPLVRYHGVFAPRSSWRSLVTPKPPARAAKSEPCAGHAPVPASPAPASPCAPPALSARSLVHADPTVRVEPTLISVLHWGRLLEGELFATSRYVEWAVLMKRSFRVRCAPMPEMRTEDARAFHDHRLSGGAPHPRSSELALAAPNGSTRARSNVGTDGVRVRRGAGGHPARARHGERTSRSSSQSCTQCTARGPCDGASGCLMRERRLARRRSRGA